ncbi:Transposase DDE domain-containing protein [Vreelandella subglaciescola]|uniref:Transposase DDE domain-containing protein n=1 Tax=Vreelandella subglaciescola TaxID=29571 RepID=A0A1M7H8C9_9GAMM|nr:Transposase DDE domain-containing protein [Halomonas subglaciescola]
MDGRLHFNSRHAGCLGRRQKGGSSEPLDHALGRSRGGLTTKIHLVCDRHGWPLTFSLSPGQDADSRHFISALESVYLPGCRGRPRKRCRYVVADKGYDSEALRRYCDRHHMKPIIPQRRMRRKPRPGLPRGFDKPKYRERNAVERCIGWLKELRRIATRYPALFIRTPNERFTSRGDRDRPAFMSYGR